MIWWMLLYLSNAAVFSGVDHNYESKGIIDYCYETDECYHKFCSKLDEPGVSFVMFNLDDDVFMPSIKEVNMIVWDGEDCEICNRFDMCLWNAQGMWLNNNKSVVITGKC